MNNTEIRVKLDGFRCLRCGHKWRPRVEGIVPTRCARCLRFDWAKADLKKREPKKI